MRQHHDIDQYPMPKEKSPIFINEPWLIDQSMAESPYLYSTKDGQEDNIRIYVPIDINRDSIIRRLNYIVSRYVEANEENETNFSEDVAMLISQIEIYDQIWSVRHGMTDNGHSKEAVSLVERFVAVLEEVPDGCAEEFPFALIDELKNKYL